jgi:hypothetical protein
MDTMDLDENNDGKRCLRDAGGCEQTAQVSMFAIRTGI